MDLIQASKRVSGTLDVQEVLQRAVDGVAELSGLDTCAVYLLEGEEIVLRATSPALPSDFPEALRAARLEDHPHIGRAVAGKPLAVLDIRDEQLTPAEQLAVAQRDLRTVLYIPLTADGSVLGVFIVGSTGRTARISEREIERVGTLAELSAMALVNARLYATSQERAEELQETLAAWTRAREERLQLQVQLQHAQKMEAVGRLAGGIAHDFNNMLSVILGHADLAVGQTDPEDPVAESLSEIINAARRSASLTRKLLAFARRQAATPVVLDLNEVITDMLKLLRRLIGEQIELVWEPGEGPVRVRIDPDQVDQILANLCVNARDAIDGPGRIVISTGHRTLAEADCRDRPGLSPGDHAFLAVADDGKGMDDETLDAIFEPFFTTKVEGEGTGLGLSTVYGIVKQNGGHISACSQLGEGTTMKVFLPGALEAPTRRDRHVPESFHGGEETVLVVEDEQAILSLAEKLLRSLGYRVLTAESPGRALDVAGRAGAVDLLVTDVVLPEMNGRELADRLRERQPDLRVLFMSGYTADVIAHKGLLNEGVLLLEKPFSISQLARKVREALAA